MNNKEYLVISRSNGTTRTGSPYASLKVTNLTETINVAVWDMPPTAAPQVGELVVFYNMKDNDGKKSCDLRDLKAMGEPLLDHPLYNLLPRPVRRDVWDDTIKKLLGYCSDKTLTAVIEEFAPKQMSAEEIKALLEEKYADVIATKNKGMIMKTVMADLKGKADGKVISGVVADLCK